MEIFVLESEKWRMQSNWLPMRKKSTRNKVMQGQEFQRSLGNGGTKYLWKWQVKNKTKNKRIHCKFMKGAIRTPDLCSQNNATRQPPQTTRFTLWEYWTRETFASRTQGRLKAARTCRAKDRGITSKLHNAPPLLLPPHFQHGQPGIHNFLATSRREWRKTNHLEKRPVGKPHTYGFPDQFFLAHT